MRNFSYPEYEKGSYQSFDFQFQFPILNSIFQQHIYDHIMLNVIYKMHQQDNPNVFEEPIKIEIL